MRSVCVWLIGMALVFGPALGVVAQEEALDEPADLTGQVISDMVMEAWATNDEATVEAIYAPDVIMMLDSDVLASNRDEIISVIAGARGIGNGYAQVGPVIEYEDQAGDLYVGTIVEVAGVAHRKGDPIVGFYRVRDGKVIRHVFMYAPSY